MSRRATAFAAGLALLATRGNLWKGPFHVSRMQLVCWKLLERPGAATAR